MGVGNPMGIPFPD